MRQETRDTNEAEAARTPRVSQPASRVSRHVSRVSRLASEAPYSFTFKAWPVVALATIGLCYLTQTVAGWFGISLPDQQNIEIVRRCLTQAFASAKHFGVAAFLVLQVVVLLPVAEELVFRGLLFRLPQRAWRKVGGRKGERRETGDERGRAIDKRPNFQTPKPFDHSTVRSFDDSIDSSFDHSAIRLFDYFPFLASLLGGALSRPAVAGRGVSRALLLWRGAMLALPEDGAHRLRDAEPRALQPHEPRPAVRSSQSIRAHPWRKAFGGREDRNGRDF